MELQPFPANLVALAAVLGAAPLILTSATSFLKIAVVLSLVRNALGVQQIPPNVVIYGLALILSAYVMTPVLLETIQLLSNQTEDGSSILEALPAATQPLASFMERNADAQHVSYFSDKINELWGAGADAVPQDAKRALSLLPAFAFTELSEAFRIGFLIYLPFIAIDIVISNILLALGMMMVSPVTISLPFKLFLFVSVDGWTRLAQALILGYS